LVVSVGSSVTRALFLVAFSMVSACGDDADGADGGPADAAMRDATASFDAGLDAALEPPDAAVDSGAVDSSPGDANDRDAEVACADHRLDTRVGIALATGSTVEADDDVAPTCAEGGPDEVFAWIAPSDGRFVFDSFGSSFDTVLSVRRASCDGPELGCEDDTGVELQSRVEATLERGAIVVISLEGLEGATGDYVLSITQPPPTEVVCDDATDDDRDGATDCFDEDCRESPTCTERDCFDTIDNDGDGAIDCKDFDCFFVEGCSEK
jgi:hypothetical protein